MPLATNLMAVGFAGPQAERLGFGDQNAFDGKGTSQAGATRIPRWTTNVALGTEAGNTAFILPDETEYFMQYFLLNTTAEPALVYPPLGASFDALAVNAPIPINEDDARIFWRVEDGRWCSSKTGASVSISGSGEADNIPVFGADADTIVDSGIPIETVTGSLQKDANLSDLSDAATARGNLGLGSAATASTGDFATAAQGEKADTALQAADLSSTIEVGKGLKPKDFFGMPTLDADDGLFIFHGEGETSPTDEFSLRVDRRADYVTPGTFGFLNAAVLIKSEITGQTTAFETGLAIIQNNHANVGGTWDTTPQHHAAVFQANRYGTAPTWALVLEAIDRQFAANPVAGIVGIELDVQGAGTDANNNKVGIAMVNRREGGLSGWTGPANEMGYGIYLVKQPDDAANNRYKIGIGFGVPAAPTEFDVGLDFISANLTIAALRLKANQNIAWVTDASRKTFYDESSTRLRYQAPGGKVFDMLDGGEFSITGAYQVFGTQVVTSRRTGWTADTGTAKRTANATYSGTAEVAYTQATIQALMNEVRDLSQTIKALKDDLITHGLIGT